LLSLIAFVFVLGVLVLAHEYGHFLFAKLFGVRVEVFSIGFGRTLASFKRGDTEYRIGAVPLGGYVKMSGENPEQGRAAETGDFLSKPVYQRAAIILAGPVFNYGLAIILFSLVFFLGFAALTATVGSVSDEFPAKAAGVQPGDRVLAINGQAVSLWDELSSVIHQQTSGQPVDLLIDRHGERLTIAVTPRVVDDRNLFGEPVKVGLIGITPGQDITRVRYGPGESMRRGVAKVVEITGVTLKAFGRMFTGRMSLKESLHGPIGIFKYTGEAARLGFTALLQMMALLSVSLAIINLFPIPVLDGGHLLFLAVEKARGRPLSVRSQEIATRIGFSLLILVMVFTMYNDIIRFKLVEQAMQWWQRK